MPTDVVRYSRYRFPAAIIRHAVWLYYRFAAARFFRKLLKRSCRVPHRLVTDRLGSYRAAHRVIMPSVAHDTTRYANNRAEVSHQPTRRRERHMRRFTSVARAQRFLAVHDAVRNLFTIGRHQLRAGH